MSDRDEDLLHRYAKADSGAQAAFAALVERHVNLVYSVARRHVRSPHLAEEVAQTVFADLAQNARRISSGTPLVAWLHVVARRAAIDVVRREVRRQRREAEAALAASTMPTPPSPWTEIEPLLDEAVESLPAPDRAAILLRFFENKSLREVGAALGTSDDAAQKRVSRALEQLRAFFLRRGVAGVTAAGLASDLSAHALQTAPVALGPAIIAGVGSSVPAAIVSTSAGIITMTFLEKALLTAGLIFAGGGALFEASALRAQRREIASVHQELDQLAAQTREAQSRLALTLRDADAAPQRLAALPAARPSPADASLDATMQAWLNRTARLRELVRQRPELAIPELETLTFDQWLAAAREVEISSEKEIIDSLAALRLTAETHFVRRLQVALRAYLSAHANAYPRNINELVPFFSPPVPAAALARYTVVTEGDPTPTTPRPAIEQKSPVDPLRDRTWTITENVSRNQRPPADADSALNEAIRAFVQANPGVRPKNAADLKPFLSPHIDLKLIDARMNPPRR